LLWPLILVLLAALSASRRALLWTTLALTVLSVAWRSYLSWEGLANRVGVGLDGNAESLLVGCSLALLLAGLRPSLRATRLWSLAAAVALAVLAVLYTGVVVLPLDMTRLLTAVTAAVVVAGSVLAPTGRTARVLGWAPLAYIGLVSYGLYLWHPVVFRLFEEHVELATLRDKVIWAPAMLGLTALVTIASYHWVEKPFNRLKDSLPGARFLPRQPEHSMSGPGASSVPATPNRGSQAGDEAPTPAQ
jgi:peptidoglycan/LPS O-acetylase OafA/YrhL